MEIVAGGATTWEWSFTGLDGPSTVMIPFSWRTQKITFITITQGGISSPAPSWINLTLKVPDRKKAVTIYERKVTDVIYPCVKICFILFETVYK
jgi:hypothetical protein